MAAIHFESIASTFTIRNPQKDFLEEDFQVEVRSDPLLGDTSVYNPLLKGKAKAFFGDSDPALIQRLVEESAKTCIFCPDRVEKSTPQYRPELVPGGRIRIGEALLFPNLFAIGKYHAVVSLSNAHFLKLSEFNPCLLENGFRAAREFLKAVYRHDQSSLYVSVNVNYLFPAGASLVHPHLQMLVTPVAYSYQGRLMKACGTYYQKKGSAYHADLIDAEKKAGSRYIAQTGHWHWMTAFSPLGSNEVTAVHERESDIAFLSDADFRDLSLGISKVLVFYEKLGHLSFNYALYAARQPHAGDGHRCLMRIINRQNLYPNYRNDDYFLQKMLQSELIINLPEELAPKLRVNF
jgi:UDPglucose--hexose-1-phosphate uridylyltransferase